MRKYKNRRTRPPVELGVAAFDETVEDYVHNLLVATSLRKLESRHLGRMLHCDALQDLGRKYASRTRPSLPSQLRVYIAKDGAPRAPRPVTGYIAANIAFLADAVGLSAAELSVLQFAAAIKADPTTTNLWKDLDAAALRRFVVKVEFRHLDRDRALRLFERVFATDLGPDWNDAARATASDALAELAGLAPGDFAAVSRRVRALRRNHTVHELLALIAAEVDAKPRIARKLGFGRD